MHVSSGKDLQDKVRAFGQLLIDNAERYVGDDIKIVSINISCEMHAFSEVPKVMVTREYHAPEIASGFRGEKT